MTADLDTLGLGAPLQTMGGVDDETTVKDLGLAEDARMWAIIPAPGSPVAVVTKWDLNLATSRPDETVVTAWSDAATALQRFGLDPLLQKATQLARAYFGEDATVTAGIDFDPSAEAPYLTFTVRGAPDSWDVREAFLREYVQEDVPPAAPIPVFVWG